MYSPDNLVLLALRRRILSKLALLPLTDKDRPSVRMGAM
jgi:hypothetical protein